MMRKRHILLMNTTRYIDRLNGSTTHFLTKQLFSVSYCPRPSSNRSIQSRKGSVENDCLPEGVIIGRTSTGRTTGLRLSPLE
jgi:hypothetical protein